MLRRPTRSSFFTYTTLFRSLRLCEVARLVAQLPDACVRLLPDPADVVGDLGQAVSVVARSEEHTSELQSPDQLVCRLLLEKKNRRSWCRSTPGRSTYVSRYC